MTHSVHQVRSFTIEGPYALRVSFDDSTEQVIDFLPALGGELFEPLRDLSVFNQVKIDADGFLQQLAVRSGPEYVKTLKNFIEYDSKQPLSAWNLKAVQTESGLVAERYL